MLGFLGNCPKCPKLLPFFCLQNDFIYKGNKRAYF